MGRVCVCVGGLVVKSLLDAFLRWLGCGWLRIPSAVPLVVKKAEVKTSLLCGGARTDSYLLF